MADTPELQLSAPTLTPTEHAEIMHLDLRAIRSKVELGKPLTAAEIRRLDMAKSTGEQPIEGEGDAPVWARSQVELAAALGCERKTIQRYLKIDGNPGRTEDGRYLVSGYSRDRMSWKTWAQSQGRLKKVTATPDKMDLECKALLLRNEETEFDLAIKRGQYTANVDVRKWFGEFGLTLKQLLLALPGQLAPDVVGLSIPEAEKRLRAGMTSALALLADNPWEVACDS